MARVTIEMNSMKLVLENDMLNIVGVMGKFLQHPITLAHTDGDTIKFGENSISIGLITITIVENSPVWSVRTSECVTYVICLRNEEIIALSIDDHNMPTYYSQD